MNILYQCDDCYAVFTGVSIYSLLENNKELNRIRIFVIDDFVSEENRQKMQQCVESYHREIVFISAKEIMESPDAAKMQEYKGTRKNKHSFLKLLVFDRLPKDVDHILYLDSDTLVLGSLEPLEGMSFQGKLLAMVMDSLTDKHKTLVGFKRSDQYFNSGVIYVDVQMWKSDNCRDRVIQHALTHSYGTVDQDLLNVEFKSEIKTLPPEYNFQPHHVAYNEKDYFAAITHEGGQYYSPEEITKARDDIRIMHFFRYLGEQPWHKGNLHPCTPKFDTYLEKSPWRGYEKQDSTRSSLFEIEEMLYRILPKRIFLKTFMLVFTLKLKRDIKSNSSRPSRKL